ncbi:MAG: Gfo/Idh/MocA family oxidoreductase [Erysipelotrichaceae bacterium]|nr:Gfo/Idh/MocA family oxidoreductase [Erysipelotrichaceae bacterium]
MKYGILSTASIARRFIDGVRENGQDEIYAIASRSEEKAQRYAREHGIPHYYGSYAQLMENPAIDIIYIPSVNVNHCRDGLNSLSYRKHTVIEKPFALNEREANDLFDLAQDMNCFLMEAQKSVFLPVTVELKRLLAEETVGPLCYIDFQMSHTNHPLDHWMYQLTMGGGALYGSGTYILEYLMYLFDDPRLTISGISLPSHSDTDAIAAFHLNTDRGFIVSAAIATNVEFDSKAVFYGTKGHITVRNFWKSDYLDITMNDGSSRQINFPMASEFAYEAAHIHDCIAAGLTESPVMTRQRTLETIRLVDCLQQQFRSGQ